MVTKKSREKKEKKVTRRITATGEDITNLTPEQREDAIKRSGFTPQTVTPQPTPTPKGGTFTGATGKPSGIELPSGRTFLGLNPDDVAEIQQREQLKQGLGDGTGFTSFGDQARVRAEEERIKEISDQPISQARKIADTSVGAFEGIDVGRGDPVTQAIANTAFGQALAGKLGLDLTTQKGQDDNLLKLTKRMQDDGLRPEQISADPTVQMLLKLELSELDLKLFKDGQAEVSVIAQLIEGIPFIGKIGGTTVGASIAPTTALAKVTDLDQKITVLGNTIRDYRMAAARNPTRKDQYLGLIEQNEVLMRNAESRIKLLIIQSPVLQNSPERVEVIQSNIQRNLNRISDADLAIRSGETLEMAMASQLNT